MMYLPARHPGRGAGFGEFGRIRPSSRARQGVSRPPGAPAAGRTNQAALPSADAPERSPGGHAAPDGARAAAHGANVVDRSHGAQHGAPGAGRSAWRGPPVNRAASGPGHLTLQTQPRMAFSPFFPAMCHRGTGCHGRVLRSLITQSPPSPTIPDQRGTDASGERVNRRESIKLTRNVKLSAEYTDSSGFTVWSAFPLRLPCTVPTGNQRARLPHGGP